MSETKSYSGWRIQTGIVIAILATLIFLYGVEWCFHLLNQPSNTSVFFGVSGLGIMAFLVAPRTYIRIWKYTFKTQTPVESIPKKEE